MQAPFGSRPDAVQAVSALRRAGLTEAVVIKLCYVLETVAIDATAARTPTLEIASDVAGPKPKFRSVMLVSVAKSNDLCARHERGFAQ